MGWVGAVGCAATILLGCVYVGCVAVGCQRVVGAWSGSGMEVWRGVAWCVVHPRVTISTYFWIKYGLSTNLVLTQVLRLLLTVY